MEGGAILLWWVACCAHASCWAARVVSVSLPTLLPQYRIPLPLPLYHLSLDSPFSWPQTPINHNLTSRPRRSSPLSYPRLTYPPSPRPSNPQCAPLQARLRLLNDWADVQRKLPEKAVQSTAGGKTSHLLRPCPTPAAPDVWPVASSKASGVFGGPGMRREGKGRGVRAGGGADVTCPSLLFVFQVRGGRGRAGEEGGRRRG